MTIPEIRRRLHELAIELYAPELAALAEATRRRPAIRHTRSVQRTPDDALAARIREYARRHPGASEWAIGVEFGLNQGRISEVLAGFRTIGSSTAPDG